MPIRLLVAVVALLAFAAPALPAQNRPVTLEPGDTVRVEAPSLAPRRVEGRLVSYRVDSLTVRDGVTGATYAFPLGAIRSLAKNEGSDRRRSVLRTARFGAFLGAAVGLVSGPFLAQAGDGDHFGSSVAVSGAAGSLIGTAVGAGVGALFPRDRWQRIRVAAPVPTP